MITIRGTHADTGVAYEIAEETPDATIASWDHLLGLLDQAHGGTAPAETPCTSSPAIAETDDVHYAEKQSAKNGAASAPPKAVAEPEAEPTPKAVPKAPPKIPAPAASGEVCETCGKAISAAEAKTSKLFASKPLCREHLQSGV